MANAIEIQVEVNGALADLVKELEGQLDTATEALAWYADGTNYIAQVDARGRKQRPIMVLKAHRAEVALRDIRRDLCIERSTMREHLRHARTKAGARTTIELVAKVAKELE